MEVENQCAILENRGGMEIAATCDGILNSSSGLSKSSLDLMGEDTRQISVEENNKLNVDLGLSLNKTTTAVQQIVNAESVIPENILSPPKSETQTDDTNTATSSSPASDANMSPMPSPTALPPQNHQIPKANKSHIKKEKKESLVKKSTKPTVNGTLPRTGKPLSVALIKKQNPTAKISRVVARKQKAVYESEISDNKIGIKLCIKKPQQIAKNAAATVPTSSVGLTTATVKAAPLKKRVRKTSTSSKEPNIKRKKEKAITTNNNNNAGGDARKSVSFATSVKDNEDKPPVEQSNWATKLPEEILSQIFKLVVDEAGTSLPTLYRLGRVCSLWWHVSLSPTLWNNIDLSGLIKKKYRTELNLKWFVDNRCSACTKLNVSNWKVSDINCFLSKLATGCPNLKSINLSGWKRFTSDNLTYLIENMKHLERLDLSSINEEINASKSAVGLQSLCNALKIMNGRLTHLYISNNRLAGIPQIITYLATHCPNLLLLDLSQVTTQATSHSVFPIEKLQHGCQKLKVLRIAQSSITFGSANLQERMDSPGFPELEELSVSALEVDARILGDEHLERILKNSTKLKILDIRGCARLTHTCLIRLPSWDLRHLFLSFCSITKDTGSGLELVASKWAHTLIELDLAWANVQKPLDNALRLIAEKGSESPLAHLNLCGSSVSVEAVKEILANCLQLCSINLASCRGLPRGVKRLVDGAQELQELRDVLQIEMKSKSLNTDNVAVMNKCEQINEPSTLNDNGDGADDAGGGDE